MSEDPPDRQPDDAEAIVKLRGEGPRVVRLSRKAIGIASAAGLAVVGGALLSSPTMKKGGISPWAMSGGNSISVRRPSSNTRTGRQSG